MPLWQEAEFVERASVLCSANTGDSHEVSGYLQLERTGQRSAGSSKISKGRGPVSWALSDEWVLGERRQWRMSSLRKENREQEDLTGGCWEAREWQRIYLLSPLVRHLWALLLTSPVFGLPSPFLARILLNQFRKNPPPSISGHPGLLSARTLLSQFSMNHPPPTSISLLSNFPSQTSSLLIDDKFSLSSHRGALSFSANGLLQRRYKALFSNRDMCKNTFIKGFGLLYHCFY